MSTLQSSPSSNSDNTTGLGVSQQAGFAPAGTQTAPTDASSARLMLSGAASGAANLLQDIAGRVFNFSFQAANGTPLDPVGDWRVRISMQPASAAIFYDNPSNAMMYPLSQTKGVIFPYTPTVSITHSAKYNPTTLTHSNYNSYFYEGSTVESISISGEFTVQNVDDGQYLMAVIHFLRACTKMFSGGNSTLTGAPPPMVFLDGYGSAYLPHVPCVVTSFQHTMPADVDYVSVPVAVPLVTVVGNQANASLYGIPTRLPTSSTINLTLQPVYSRNNLYNNYSMERYVSGLGIQPPAGSSGGFI